MSTEKRVTLYDVAREAGVSYQTVSRVINDSPNVAPKTRSRVLRVIRELDYRPNRAAQMLSTHRSHTLEVVTLSIWGAGSASLAAMSGMARKLGYQLSITALNGESIEKVIAGAAARLVDGLVLILPNMDISDDRLLEISHGIPLVRMSGAHERKVASVAYDQVLGARLATQHLVDLGHRQIATITGPFEFHDARMRYRGWQMTLEMAGLEPGPVETGQFSPDAGYQSISRLLDRGEKFTALFAANDGIAFGAIDALRERGFRVPQDVSVVGYDDVNVAAYYAPRLTTVRQDAGVLGDLTLEYLVSLIEKPDTPIHERVLKPELIVRQSTRRLKQ